MSIYLYDYIQCSVRNVTFFEPEAYKHRANFQFYIYIYTTIGYNSHILSGSVHVGTRYFCNFKSLCGMCRRRFQCNCGLRNCRLALFVYLKIWIKKRYLIIKSSNYNNTYTCFPIFSASSMVSGRTLSFVSGKK